MRIQKRIFQLLALLVVLGFISCATEGGSGGEHDGGHSDSLTEVDSLVENLELLQKHM
jgi:hypothetical protein